MTQKVLLLHGDCLARLQDIPKGSVQAVVCDPPYGIGFLGVAWDTYSGEDRDFVSRGNIQDKMGSVCHPHNSSEQAWTRGRENRAYGDFCLSWLQLAFGVLEPGGVLKAFSGTRTFHRLAAAMVEAGFQDIRMEAWGYATGFPKSLNVSKALDKIKVTQGSNEWAGWGTALKPAWEPVIIGRKP